MPVAQTSSVATLSLHSRWTSERPHFSRVTTVTFQPASPSWRAAAAHSAGAPTTTACRFRTGFGMVHTAAVHADTTHRDVSRKITRITRRAHRCG